MPDARKVTELDHKTTVERMKDIADEVERLGKKSELTKEDELRWADINDEFEQLDNHRRHLERSADLARVREVINSPFGKVERGSTDFGPNSSGSRSDEMQDDPLRDPRSVEDHLSRMRNPWDLSDLRTYARSKVEVSKDLRSRALSAIERMPAATDNVRKAATHIIERWDDGDSRIARLCLATSSPEYVRAWSKVAAGRGHMISPEEQRALERAMSLADAEGGYLVPFQLDPTVIITSDGSRNQIRQIARQVVATGDVWNGVSAGAVEWSWDAEAEPVSDDSPTFGQPRIPIHKAQGFVPISIEALQDAANVTTEIARLLAFGRDVLEAEAFTAGTGVGMPTGVVTALTGTPSEITATAGNALTVGHIYQLDNSLPSRYRSNASWLGNRGIFNLVRQLDTQGGANMWERIGADQPPQLLGRGVYEAEAMDSALGTAPAGTANRVLVYGDFSNYVIADRIGMTVEFINHLFRQEVAGAGFGMPTGQRGWFAYYRVGADSINDAGLRLLNIPSAA
jgi:HK97 family phage major capsid protein